MAGINRGDNELLTLEIIHQYVEVLDRYFGNVCELDIIFNFHKVSAQPAVVWASARGRRALQTHCFPPSHPGSPPPYLVCLAPTAPAQAYYILDELLLGGELQESNKREVLRVCTAQDDLVAEDDGSIMNSIKRR